MNCSHLFTSIAVLTTAGCGLALAQSPAQFAERIPHFATGAISNDSSGIALADVDGDGDPDMLVTNWAPSGSALLSGQARLYLNDGRGEFRDVSSSRLPQGIVNYHRAEFVDFDQDGDPDAVLGGGRSLWSNDGDGNFTSVTSSFAGISGIDGFFFEDFDGDGHLDFITERTSVYPQHIALMKGDGLGGYTEVADAFPAELDSLGYKVAGDVDGDGDMDLIVSRYSSSTRVDFKSLWRNDGSGHFTTDLRWIAPSRNEPVEQLLLADLDGDGDDDLISANGQAPDSVYENIGGMFVPYLADGLPLDASWTNGVAALDVDADGDIDLCFALADEADRLFLNDGAAGFSLVSGPDFAPGPRISRAVAAGDLDGDGRTDLALANLGPNEIWFNDGEGRLLPGLPDDLPRDAELLGWNMAAGDIDSDGDRDLVLSRGSDDIRIWHNDGHGRFEDLGDRVETVGGSRQPQLADIDGDGDLDMLVLADAAWLRNSGDGDFDVDEPLPVAGLGYNASRAEFADFNGDGAIDMIAINTDYHGSWGLYLNDGTGVFSRVASVFDGNTYSDVKDLRPAVGDIDGDGDLDVALGNFGGSAKLFVNDGSAVFSDESATRLPAAPPGLGAGLGDIDGDGDLDLVIGRSVVGNGSELYKNDGSGLFTTWDGLPRWTYLQHLLQFIDVDVDGDPDLLVHKGNAKTPQLLINDGTGLFSVQPRLPESLPGYSFIDSADYDGDGDPDILFGYGATTPRLMRNLHRHAVADTEVRIGTEFRAQVWSRPGYGQEPGLALIAIGLEIATSPIHLPLHGNWWLAPENLQILGPVLHLPSLAPAQFSLQIPAIPAGIGLTLYSQAAVVGVNGQRLARFTNAEQAPVRR